MGTRVRYDCVEFVFQTGLKLKQLRYGSKKILVLFFLSLCFKNIFYIILSRTISLGLKRVSINYLG